VYDLASFDSDDVFLYLNENIEVITVLVYTHGWENTLCDGYVGNCQTVPNSQFYCSMLAVQHNLIGKSGMADHNFFLAYDCSYRRYLKILVTCPHIHGPVQTARALNTWRITPQLLRSHWAFHYYQVSFTGEGCGP
jgi:hypothetical protein